MTYHGNAVLAVIPARGGSKSIPRKNLCRVGGLSLVARAAAVAAALPWIDRAFLSTDDEEIAEEGRRHGLEVPLLRPAELAGDAASSVDMWRHAWLVAEECWGCTFEVSILLEPTSPLRRPGDIEETVKKLCMGDYLSAVTVSATPAHFTPYKTLTVDKAGKVGFYIKEGERYSLRQKIPGMYFHRNGICYAVRRAAVVDRKTIIGEKCAAVFIERPVVNIDEPFDLEFAEYLLSREETRE